MSKDQVAVFQTILAPIKCLVTLAYTGLIPLKEWEGATLHEVLYNGDKLYQYFIKLLQEK